MRRAVPNRFQTVCQCCHAAVGPGDGLAVWRGGKKGWRVLCTACVDDPDGAAGRGSLRGWVFALALPGTPGLAHVGCSRFPALRCAQVVVGRTPSGRPLVCDAWAIAVEDRLAARAALRAAAGCEGAGGAVRASLDEILSTARATGLDGEAVRVRPTLEEWRKSGR